jgi:hypothetical protein
VGGFPAPGAITLAAGSAKGAGGPAVARRWGVPTG